MASNALFENMTEYEWKRLMAYLYSPVDVSTLPKKDLQVIRRDLLELSLKVQEYVNAHEDDTNVIDKGAELDINVLYLLRDLDWLLEGLI